MSDMAEDSRRSQQYCPHDSGGSGTKVTGKGMFLHSAVSSPLVCSKRFVPVIKKIS